MLLSGEYYLSSGRMFPRELYNVIPFPLVELFKSNQKLELNEG